LVLSLYQVQFLRYRTVVFEATLAYGEETWGAREREREVGMRSVEKRRGGRGGEREEGDRKRKINRETEYFCLSTGRCT
jgi:hypothetical protein